MNSNTNTNTNTNTGLTVSVYRDAGSKCDCTNGGFTSRFTQATVCDLRDEIEGVIKSIDGPFKPSEDRPELVLIRDCCAGRERIRAVPADLVDTQVWTMFGGNYITTSDSRFPAQYPVPVYDRVMPSCSTG